MLSEVKIWVGGKIHKFYKIFMQKWNNNVFGAMILKNKQTRIKQQQKHTILRILESAQEKTIQEDMVWTTFKGSTLRSMDFNSQQSQDLLHNQIGAPATFNSQEPTTHLHCSVVGLVNTTTVLL